MTYWQTAIENYIPGKVGSIIIASRPGMGKTQALMQLPDSIIFDYEDSSSFYRGKADVVNIQDIVNKEGCGPIAATGKAISALKAAGKKYTYGIIDTISKLDDHAEGLALVNYKNSPIGKNFNGRSVFELPRGSGYYWHREAFQSLFPMFDGLFDKQILVAHVKDSSIVKDGEDIHTTDIRLTGALRDIFSAKQDACGILTMDKKEPNKRYLDFRKTPSRSFVKTRADHLRDKKILISEINNKGEFVTHWDKVFLNL